MKTNRRIRAWVAFAAALGLFFGAGAHADEPGISVLGAGEARVKPDRVEIEVRAAGAGELTSDALVKYQDSLRRMLEAFEALKIDNLKIEQQPLGIGQSGGSAVTAAAILGQGEESPAGKTEVEISRTLRIVLSSIDKLSEDDLTETVGRLIDTAHDAGAQVGGGGDSAGALQRMMLGGQAPQASAVTFVVSDPSAAREEATAKAFAQAEATATRLASLAKARLGKVLAIDESPAAAASDEESTQAQLISAVYGISTAKDDRLTSNEWGEIPLRVSLRVRFALDDEAPAATPRKKN